MSQMVTSDALDYQQGVQNEPLTEQEIKLINRLFSDPTVLPRDFKRWVTDHASDSVDITKSQVHGLINAKGGVYIPAPPRVNELKFAYFSQINGIPSGSGGNVGALTAVDCQGPDPVNAVIYEFYAPFAEYTRMTLNLTVDGVPQGLVAEYAATGAQGGPWTAGWCARSPIYIQCQFNVTKALHDFSLGVQTYGNGAAGYQYIAGGANVFGLNFAPGFTRVSRA